MPDRPPSPPLSAPRPSALRPERIAHRGAPREFYENTLDGFVRALERGADAVELDVHKTRDDTVVIHHDADVIVAPNTRAAISTLTWADICAVRLAGGAHIPTLAQVMDAVADRATVYVELKGDNV
ncbi:MAG TPA: glycerophosphodiester phosphodiesterase, partial [Gemmatimonadaceae bacterium]